jgi:hypothetical protein
MLKLWFSARGEQVCFSNTRCLERKGGAFLPAFQTDFPAPDSGWAKCFLRFSKNLTLNNCKVFDFCGELSPVQENRALGAG